jgi:hypothetical protein
MATDVKLRYKGDAGIGVSPSVAMVRMAMVFQCATTLDGLLPR